MEKELNNNIKKIDIVVPKKDYRIIPFSIIRNGEKTQLDNDDVVVMTVGKLDSFKYDDDDDESDYIFRKTLGDGIQYNGETGNYDIQINSEDTIDMIVGENYGYDITIYYGGNKPAQKVVGKFIVSQKYSTFSVAPTSQYQDKSITIVENGIILVEPDEGYKALSSVSIETNIPEPTLQTKSVDIITNGETSVVADLGYDGLEEVNIQTNVPARVQSKSITIQENGITTVEPDSEYDGLSSINISTNVPARVQSKIATPTTSSQIIEPDNNYDGLSSVTINAVTSNIDNNIVAQNIKDGIRILGVTGTVEELNGETKTVTPTTSQQIITPSANKNALTEVTVEAVTSAIDANIVQGNIKSGVTILGVTGNVEPDKPDQTKTVTPTTSQQVIEPDNGYELASVTVNAVTSAIDNNIMAENIKKDISILGITGTYEGSGGGGGAATEKDVNFYDYDGTLLYSYIKNEFLALTEMPANPSHEGLVAQGWNWSLSDAKDYVTDYGILDVGQMYTTASGLSEFDIELTTVTGLEVTLKMNGNKNWGDGTTDTNTTHTYSSAGKYTITCDGDTISSSSSSGGLFGQKSTSVNYYLISARLVNMTNSAQYVFNYCYSLKYIVLSNNITNFGTASFSSAINLKHITLPNSITILNNQLFYAASRLLTISLPNTILQNGFAIFEAASALKRVCFPKRLNLLYLSSVFKNCSKLQKMIILQDLSAGTISSQSFSFCTGLIEIIMPKKLIKIAMSALTNCYSLKLIDFTRVETIPTLENTNAFNNISQLCKMVVPDSLYNDWITASNWSTYADYIVKESEYNAS